MKGRNWGRKRLCVATEFGRFWDKFSFILVPQGSITSLCSGNEPALPSSPRTAEIEPTTILDSGFGIRDTGLRIPFQWNLDSRSQSLYRFQSPGFRTPEAKLFRIPESRFSYIGQHSSTSFLFFYTTTKNTKNHLSIQGVTFLAISVSRDTVAKKLLMWAFTTLPPIHMRW